MDKPRTEAQNKALHLYFTQLAELLNDAGLDIRKVLKPTIDIPWSTETIKEFLWKPVMNVQLGKKSTTEMTTKDISAVYDTINKHIGEKFGLHIDFPSIESLINKQRQNEN